MIQEAPRLKETMSRTPPMQTLSTMTLRNREQKRNSRGRHARVTARIREVLGEGAEVDLLEGTLYTEKMTRLNRLVKA
jgi:hypothetical protein